MNIPNILTILRIVLVPIYLYIFYTIGENHLLYAGLIFILAGITDLLDGHIARKYDQVTDLGAMLDPFADKLMTFAVLISFTTTNLIPAWIIKVLGVKELAMIIGGIVLFTFKGKQVLPADKYGKIATTSFYLAILSVIFKTPIIIIKTFFILTVILNIIAFLNYLIIFLSMDNKKAKSEKV